jgi:uncharacterized membrane protein YfcA
MALLILLLGLVAGALTTLAGAGGGVFLILALSMLLDPHAALAVSAPVLLVGNVHRLFLYRDRVDRAVAARVVAGALPAALIAGAVTVSIPSVVLRVLLLAITAYAIARAFGHLAWRPPRSLLAPAGAVVGGVSATSGGAGLLAAPLLLSTGLTGERYVATSAAVAISTHIGRLIGYGSRGLLSREILGVAMIAAVAVVVGNLAGDRARSFLTGRRAALVEHGTLAVCAALAILGLRT